VAPKPSLELIQFGIFEVDCRAGELRKQGHKIRLQDLPFQFLTALLERPGQLVTREELARRLWPDSVQIDIDNGLNTAARKLRNALGDDAGTPRFIETLPRRGYRFIGAVLAVPAVQTAPAEGAPAAQLAAVVAAPEIPGPISAPAAAEVPLHRSFRRWVVAAAASIALGLLAFRLMMPSRSPGMLRMAQLTHTGRVEPSTAMLTDGSRIYFNERSGGTWSLAQVSVEGGTPVPFKAPRGVPELRAISPNLSELLVNIAANNEAEAPFWMIPTVAGSPRRLGSVLGHAATWSRDGHSIVYAFGAALYRVNGDGTDARKLTDTPAPPSFIHWSPPGQPDLLRFSLLGPVASVWECSPDGSGLRPFQPAYKPWPRTIRGEFAAGWTPDGRYYLFESLNEPGAGFWAVRDKADLLHPFDRRPFQLYATPNNAGPFLSGVDGKKLYFASGQERRELVAYDGRRSQFLPFLSGAAVRDVEFSKDGQWVAYESIPEGELWRSRADGSERLQLTSRPLWVREPRWSPDGRRIAFVASQAGTARNKVFVMAPSGGSMEAVPMEPDTDMGSPSWSPDGQSLMVNRWQPRALLETMEVCVLNLKTRQTVGLPGSQGLLRPEWSPDGQYVAALREGGSQVVLYSIASHQWFRIAEGANYGIPFWTRDSRYFYFQEVLGDADQPIFRVHAATRAAERMMSSQQLPQSGFSGYTLTGLTPGGAPIATVLRSNGDIYGLDVDLP